MGEDEAQEISWWLFSFPVPQQLSPQPHGCYTLYGQRRHCQAAEKCWGPDSTLGSAPVGPEIITSACPPGQLCWVQVLLALKMTSHQSKIY